MYNPAEQSRFIEDLFHTVRKDAIKIGDDNLSDSIEEVINLCQNRELRRARKAIKKINYSDLQIKLYLIIAVLSREEQDLKTLRKMLSRHLRIFGEMSNVFFIFVAQLSGNKNDIERARRAVERSSPFAKIQDYLFLFLNFGEEQDLDKARQYAKIEISDDPYIKPAGLVMIAMLTGALEDFQNVLIALKLINEDELRRRIPADINVELILKESSNFEKAWERVNQVCVFDDRLKARVWTLIGIKKMKWERPTIVIE